MAALANGPRHGRRLTLGKSGRDSAERRATARSKALSPANVRLDRPLGLVARPKGHAERESPDPSRFLIRIRAGLWWRRGRIELPVQVTDALSMLQAYPVS